MYIAKQMEAEGALLGGFFLHFFRKHYPNSGYVFPFLFSKHKQRKVIKNGTVREKPSKRYVNGFDTAAELARETDFTYRTILGWIKQGKIKAKQRRPGTCWRISKSNVSLAKLRKLKPYKKYYKTYSETEIHVLIMNKGLSDETLAKMIDRNPNSVRIKRCRLRKQGYDA